MSAVPATIVQTIRAIEAVLLARARPARGAAAAGHARALLEPLAMLVAEQGATIRDQAETIGRLKAELEVTSEEVMKAKVRESQLLIELERSRAERAAEPPVKTDTQAPRSWRKSWHQGALTAAVLMVVVLVVVLLLFVVPPLDASL
jgi:hypothetical protein